MTPSEPICRLIATMQPSLVMYLADSGIWSYPGPEPVKLALADAADGLQSVIERATTLLGQREVIAPRKAAYPLSFTGLHDADLGTLLPRVIAGLKRQHADLEGLTGAAGADAAAAELVADAMQSTRQHVDALEQLAARLKAGLAGSSTTAG